MKKDDFITLLSKPEDISLRETTELENVVEEHPYFQTAYAIRLKGLKQYKNFLYNKALRKTAALTTDRSVLFDWITSKNFTQNKVAKDIKQQNTEEDTPKIEKDLHQVLQMNDQEAHRVLDPHLFEAVKTLELGKALEFNRDEAHSFSEWLKVTKAKPVERKTDDKQRQEPEKKDRKSILIDNFIAKNPKITPSKKPMKEQKTTAAEYFPDQLMTETLARVYMEQRNFDKAIRAYKILILKNPEKSGFFADQIRAIEKLQENK